MLVQHYVEYYARNQPELLCYTHGSTVLNYAELQQLSNRAANGLLSVGIKPGQRVAILGANSVAHSIILLAAAKIGAVAVPINYRLAPPELAYILNDAGAEFLLVLNGMEALFEKASHSPAALSVIFESPAQTHGGPGWHQWLNQCPDTCPAASGGTHDALLQLYTSGTTGHPKGVVSTHHNLLSLAQMNNTATPNRSSAGSDAIICAPLFHIGGIGSLVNALVGGQHTVLLEQFDADAVVSCMEQYNVNTVFLVPAMIMALLQLPNIESRDFSKLKHIFYGASPITESVLRRALAVFGCDFIQMYGMTETTGTVVALTAADHRKALQGQPELLRSCGRPSVGAQVRIVRADGTCAKTTETGEIWLKSDTNMLHYHNLPEATASSLTNGWIHTGDAGYLDHDGYLYLKDRLKDMVVSGGENIYPTEVENAVAEHNSVADVAVIGIPDEKFGEALLAFVVLTEGGSLTVQELIDFCRPRIAGYKIPRRLDLLDELPRNASGKILKKELRAPFWKAATRPIA